MKTKPFERVIGYDAIKKELMQVADSLANPEVYGKLGTKPPRGVLLYGEPGVGKTLMAGEVVKASGRCAFTCRKDKPNGDFVKAIKKVFSQAVEAAPSIVFLDDMDKFANGDDRHPDAEEYVTVQSCIDEIKGKDVFVLATANSIRVLPRSLLRAGRFDRVIEVKNPRGEDAVNIIGYYMKQKKFVSGIDPAEVGAIMDGHSCAELESIINDAGLYAGYDRSDGITMEHFMKAYLHTVHNVPIEELNGDRTVPDLDDPDDPKSLIIWHEASHAALQEAFEPGSVTLISAYCGRGENGGFTSNRRSNVHKLEQVHGRVICSLAGMAAVEQKFGFLDIGNSGDLERAFETVNRLVSTNAVCGFGMVCGADYSSANLDHNRELTVSSEVERLYRRAKVMLNENRELFCGIARALADKCYLTAADIKKIKEGLKAA